MAKKYLSLERLTEYDDLIKAEIAKGDASVKSYVDTEVAKKANATHSHNDLYYTETEIDTKLNGINTSISNITSGTTPVKKAEQATTATTSSNAEKLGGQLPSYYAKASDIPTGALADKDVVSESDLDSALAEKVNAAAEGNHSHSNKTVLDGITSAKVSAWDSAEANAKAHSDTNLATAKSYTDGKITALLDGADDTTLDSIKELADAIKENDSAIGALNDIAAGKANATHSHAISDVTGLQSALDGKAAASHGTHVTFDSTNKPKMDGTAAFGTSTSVARADHVHPTDTSRAAQTDLDALEVVVNGKANASHTHAISDITNLQSTLDAKTNQNAFSNVKVGSTTIAADTTTDTLTLVAGSNVTLTPDATGDSITIAATDTVYTHPNSGVTAGTYRSVTVNAQGHVTAGSNPTTLAGYGITDAASKTHSHAISDITNLNTTLTNASNAITANTNSINTHTSRISELETKVGDGFEEITSAEIQALFA